MVISNLVISLVSYCRKSLNLIFLESNHGQKLWIWPRFVSKKFKKSTFLANAHFESRHRNVLLILCVGRGMKKCREKNWQRHLWTAPNTAKGKLDLKPHRHERSRLPCPGSMLRTCRGAKHFMKSQLHFQKSLKLCSLESENLLWILVIFLRVLFYDIGIYVACGPQKRPNHGLRTHDG